MVHKLNAFGIVWSSLAKFEIFMANDFFPGSLWLHLVLE